MIPFDLKIYSWVYETLYWLPIVPLLAFLPIAVLIREKRRIWKFLLMISVPLLVFAFQLGILWCGFHYRMELRDRWGTETIGGIQAVNIRRMPPEIAAEYARHDYHPRERDLKAATAGALVLLPVLLLLEFLFFAMLTKKPGTR